MLVNDQEPKEIDLTSLSEKELADALRLAEADQSPVPSELDLIPYEDEIVCAPEETEAAQLFNDSEVEQAACEPVKIPFEELTNPITAQVIPPFSIDRSSTPQSVGDFDPSVIDQFISSLETSINSVLDPLGTEQRRKQKNGQPIPATPLKPSLSTGALKEGQVASDGVFAEREQTVPLFSSNGSGCFSVMNSLSKKIQDQTEEYKKAKEEVQSLQLDYYYTQLSYKFYESFLKGYDESNRLQRLLSSAQSATEKTKISDTLKNLVKTNKYGKNAKDAQKQLSSAYGKFSSQLYVDAEKLDAGFDKSKDLFGTVKDIPTKLSNDITSIDLTVESNQTSALELAKKAELDLDNAYKNTLKFIGEISFSYGVNKFSKKEKLPSDFKTRLAFRKTDSDDIKKKYDSAKEREKIAEAVISKVNDLVNQELAKMGCSQKEIVPGVESGKDVNFKNVSTNPTIFDYAWWKKFSTLATIVNLIPVHWPIGLIIPTPVALIKVPFPIIWIPLFVIASETGIYVLFIGQCGILPCPFLFAQHFLPFPVGPFKSNNPYFILAIRGAINISSHESLSSIPFPSINPLMQLINEAVKSLRSGVGISVGSLLSEAKQKEAELEQSAYVYFEYLKKSASDAIKDAENKAATIKDSAKKSLDAASDNLRKSTQETISAYENEFSIQEKNLKSQLENLKDPLSREMVSVRLNALRDKFNKDVEELVKVNETRLNEEINRFEQEKKRAQDMIDLAKQSADNLVKNASDKYNDEISKAKKQYDEKINEIRERYNEYDSSLEDLRNLIGNIKVPVIDLNKINVSSLIQGFSLSLGSVQSMASILSPKITHMNFLAELNPSLAASLPMISDEFPVWERLSLDNIAFLLFLWKWCSAGKEKGGFFRDPF
jgi:hypothetical protein